MAILQGLAKAHQCGFDNVIVITDSQYCITVLSKSHRRIGTLNMDIVKQTVGLLCVFKHRPKFEWVKGHSGVPFNELADKLATAARDGKTLA